MNYQEEIQKYRNILKDEIMKFFIRKNSTVKSKSIIFGESFRVPMDIKRNLHYIDYEHVMVGGVNGDGSIICHDRYIDEVVYTLDDLSIEQLIVIKSVLMTSDLIYKY
jgi:hypothetical protein